MPSTPRPADLVANLATEIRVEMTRQRRTLDEAGAHLGFGGSAISRKLNGSRALTAADVFALADWLGLTAGELVTRAEESATTERLAAS